MEMHVPSDEGAVSEVLSDEQRDAVIDGLSDRTPADVIARSLMCELDEMAGEPPSVLDVHEAKRVLDALAAAGLRVVPIPDDNTRALADHELYEQLVGRDAVRCDHEHDAAIDPDGDWITVEVHPQVIYDALVARQERALAALLNGQPEDRPDRSPTPSGPEDWARAWLVPVPGGAYPVIDGQRCTLDEHRQFRDAWSAMYDVWLVCCWMARVPAEVERLIVTAREASLLAHAGPDAVAPDLARKWHVGGSGDTR